MKRIAGLLLAIAMLLALAAPALADMEIMARGSYTIDVNLRVPDDPSALVGGFTVTIPESIHLQYGVVNNPQYYSISIDPGRFPVGRNLTIEVSSNDYYEWENEDGIVEPDNHCCLLVATEEVDGNDFRYWVYNNYGMKLRPIPYEWEANARLSNERFVDNIINRGDDDTYRDGTINLVVDYSNDRQAPGNYHSTLTFHISTWWHYDIDTLASELNRRYVVADGYEYRRVIDENDITAAFGSNGWPIEGHVVGTEPII